MEVGCSRSWCCTDCCRAVIRSSSAPSSSPWVNLHVEGSTLVWMKEMEYIPIRLPEMISHHNDFWSMKGWPNTWGFFRWNSPQLHYSRHSFECKQHCWADGQAGKELKIKMSTPPWCLSWQLMRSSRGWSVGGRGFPHSALCCQLVLVPLLAICNVPQSVGPKGKYQPQAVHGKDPKNCVYEAAPPTRCAGSTQQAPSGAVVLFWMLLWLTGLWQVNLGFFNLFSKTSVMLRTRAQLPVAKSCLAEIKERSQWGGRSRYCSKEASANTGLDYSPSQRRPPLETSASSFVIKPPLLSIADWKWICTCCAFIAISWLVSVRWFYGVNVGTVLPDAGPLQLALTRLPQDAALVHPSMSLCSGFLCHWGGSQLCLRKRSCLLPCSSACSSLATGDSLSSLKLWWSRNKALLRRWTGGAVRKMAGMAYIAANEMWVYVATHSWCVFYGWVLPWDECC